MLARLGRGLSNAQIGHELFLSEATVKGHVTRLLDKLDCANRTQAGLLARDAGPMICRSALPAVNVPRRPVTGGGSGLRGVATVSRVQQGGVGQQGDYGGEHTVTRARVTVLTLVGMLVLAASACNGSDPEASGPEGTPAPTPPASPPPGEQECFAGTFQVESIESTSSLDTPIGPITARSEAGSMTVEIGTDGTWQLADDGSQPVTFDVAGAQVEATVEGSATGTYTEQGETYLFATDSTTGGGEIDSPLGSHEFSMEEAGSVLLPDGETTVDCAGEQATLTSETVVLTLARQEG